MGQISKSAYQLFQADIRVRAHITKELEEHLDRDQNNQAAPHYALQLALCHKIGFGAYKSDGYTRYLSLSRLNESDLQLEIEKIGETQWRNKIILDLLCRGYLDVVPSFYDLALDQEKLEKVICDSKRELADAQLHLPAGIVIILQSRLA